MDDAQRAQILAGAGYMTGAVGAIAPRRLAALFGIRDAGGEYEAVLRMMSFRNLALAGATTLIGDDEDKRHQFLMVAAAMFTADTLATVLAAATGKVSARTALMLGTTTGALAAVAATGAIGQR